VAIAGARPSKSYRGLATARRGQAGIVSATTPTRSSRNAARSVSSRNWAEKALRVFMASYFLQ